MTVGELMELLTKYERDRQVCVRTPLFFEEVAGIRSIEPGGYVVIVQGGSPVDFLQQWAEATT